MVHYVRVWFWPACFAIVPWVGGGGRGVELVGCAIKKVVLREGGEGWVSTLWSMSNLGGGTVPSSPANFTEGSRKNEWF